jgi:putative DNA primase/helicase
VSGAINAAEINMKLRAVDQWATHRDKVPYISGTERKASSTDPATWGTFDDARTAVDAGKADGLYYALLEGSGIVGIDLDHCVTDGVVDPWAMVYVRLFNSYTCLSASLTGIRIFVKGTKPSTDCKRGPIECYDHDRFLSITDQRVPGTPNTIEERQAELEAFHKLAFPPKPKPERKTAAAPASTTSITLTDDERFAAAMRSDKFARLHRGDISEYIGDSEARIAYLNIAAGYSAQNQATMERWIRASGLNSAKFDDRRGDTTFLQTEIDDACNFVDWEYTPGAAWPILEPTPLERIETSGSDGAQGCQGCRQREAMILEQRATIAELRAGQSKIKDVLAIPTRQLNATQKLVAIVSTFEVLSKESRQPGADHRLYRATVADRAGISEATAGDAMKALSKPGGVFTRAEGWERISTTTGEIFDPPRKVVDYRPVHPTIAATFEALKDYTPEGKKPQGGKREKTVTLDRDKCICPNHPESGSVVRCAETTCNRPLTVAVAADPERWRPSGQLDLMATEPPTATSVVNVSMKGQLDPMADPPATVAPSGQDDPIVGAVSPREPLCLDCRRPSPRGLTPCQRCVERPLAVAGGSE